MRIGTRGVPLLLLLLGLAACQGSATPVPSPKLLVKGTLTTAADISHAPQEFYPPGSREPGGFDVDLGKALAQKLGLTYKLTNQNFDALVSFVEVGKYDAAISAIPVTEDAKKHVDLIPYLRAGASFVVGKGFRARPTKLEDLCGLKVGFKGALQTQVLGLDKAGQACAAKPVEVTVFAHDADAVTQLKAGAIDVHYTDTPAAIYETQQDTGLVIANPTAPLDVVPEGIAVRKTNPNLLAALRDALKALQSDGTYDRLLKRWGLANQDIRKP